MWRSGALRSAGFPARTVLSLASPTTAQAAETVLQAEEYLAGAMRSVAQALRDEAERGDYAEWARVRSFVRKLTRGTIPALRDGAPAICAALLPVHEARKRVEDATVLFHETAGEDERRTHETLRNVLRSDRFLEAVSWQNRTAFQGGLSKLLGDGIVKLDSKTRSAERLAATYLQRYCVKNDTIGSFGPTAFAELRSGGPAIDFCPGPDLIRNREVHFEGWCIDALARKLGEDRGLRPWLAPRPLPLFYVDGSIVHLPVVASLLRQGKVPSSVRSALEVSPLQLRLLHVCDGKRTAREIAGELMADPSLGVRDEAMVYDQLERLCDLGVLKWALEVPLVIRPESELRRRLERVEDEALRSRALGALTELVAARDLVGEATGNSLALRTALDEMDTTFVRLTGESPTRAGGRAYAARTLVYEECCRDVDVSLGPTFIERVGPPLSLLLSSARWFTYQVARRFREAFLEIHQRLSDENDSRSVDFHSFAEEALPLLQDADCEPIREVTSELQRRWAEVLRIPPSGRQVQLSSQEIRPRVEAAFDAPHPGWSLARYCSPDIMIAARSAEAIQQGEYRAVLGEVHLENTLARTAFVEQHPDPEKLRKCRDVDIPRPCVIPVPSRAWNVQRMTMALVSPKDFWFQYAPDPWDCGGMQSVSVGELVVESDGEELVIRTRDGRLRLDAVEFFGHTLSNQCLSYPALLAPAGHLPRIVVDEVVICRESWSFEVDELPRVSSDRGGQFLAIRRWARGHGIPRFVFARVPGEPKPYYLDLESLIYVDLLAKAVRGSVERCESGSTVRFTEMLPGFDECWLADAGGNRYTSELRLVAVDPVAFPG